MVSDRGNLLLRGRMEGETFQYSTIGEFEVHHLADVDGPIGDDSAVFETTFDFETQTQEARTTLSWRHVVQSHIENKLR